MPTIRDQAICIRHWDFSETSQTVSLFTRDHGTLRGLAKGARRDGGRFSGGIDLLARGELVAIVKPDRDLATLTDWDLQEVFWGLRATLRANHAGYYIADLVQQFFPDSAPHPTFFDALCDALRSAGSSRELTEPTLLRFQWRLLVEAGFQPRLEYPTKSAQASTLGFDPARGEVVGEGEVGPQWRVRRSTIECLRCLESESPIADESAARRAGSLLAAYVREVLQREPPTMRLVFPDLDGRRVTPPRVSG